MWSVGCILAELILGTPIFAGDSSVDQLVEIVKVLGTPTMQQIRDMNPAYADFQFPAIVACDWDTFFVSEGRYVTSCTCTRQAEFTLWLFTYTGVAIVVALCSKERKRESRWGARPLCANRVVFLSNVSLPLTRPPRPPSPHPILLCL